MIALQEARKQRIQCIISYNQFIYLGCRCIIRSYVNAMCQIAGVGELEWCEWALLERSTFFLYEKKSATSKNHGRWRSASQSPHSHHSSSPTTSNWPVKIAHVVERHVNPSATHLKLTLQKYKKMCELQGASKQ